MSAVTSSHFKIITIAAIVVTFGLIALALTDPNAGQPARPGEISKTQYEEIVNDLKGRCPQLRPFVVKLYQNDGMISIPELKLFKEHCAKLEQKTKQHNQRKYKMFNI